MGRDKNNLIIEIKLKYHNCNEKESNSGLSSGSDPPHQLPPRLCTGHDLLCCGTVLWLLQVTCPGLVPPAFSLPGHKTLKDSQLSVNCLVTIKPSACYQRYSHPKSKTQHRTSSWGDKWDLPRTVYAMLRSLSSQYPSGHTRSCLVFGNACVRAVRQQSLP